MATVYLAHDVKHKRKVAVKVLRPELAAMLGAERFVQEITTTANLRHPNILPLYDSGEADSFLYYVMPYVEGESLRDRLNREGQLPLDDALQIVGEVADALAYAHAQGVVHRDIKPENILLEEGHAVVSDFGIARAVRAVGEEKLTGSGLVVGTPAYMSPEQASGDVRIDGRSDLYSLAAVLYEMLGGETPHSGPSPQAILARQLTEQVRSLIPLRHSVTPALDTVLRKALAPAPADRFRTTSQFAEALSAAVTGEATLAAAARGRATAQPRLRSIGIAVLLALVVGAAWWSVRVARGSEPDSVVVLPFTNVGGDPSNQAFADGLVEILTSKLTQLERFFDTPLWVVPASEVRTREITSVEGARREFGASLAVTGSVQRQASDIRLTLNLVDARNLRQVRSAVLAGKLTQLAIWQDGVMNELAEMLNVELHPAARRTLAAGGTSQPQAYDYYVQGRGYLQSVRNVDNLNRARRLFGQATERDSLYALAYAGLGETYWELFEATGDTQWVAPAITNSERALQLSDSLPPVWVTLGLINAGTGQYENAVDYLRRAIALDPYNSQAYGLLARAYGSLDRPADAESTYARAIALKPFDWRGYSNLGVFYYVEGRYEDAVTQFLRVAELNPMNRTGYSNAGAIYFFLERWSEAHEMFERSLEIEPSSSAYSNLGTLDYYEGRFEQAAQRFAKALESRDQDYLLWGNLADAYYWIPDRREESLETYRRAVGLAEGVRQVNPKDPKVLTNLFEYYAVLGERAQAKAMMEQLAPLVGDDPEIMFSVAHAHEVMGQRRQALEWMGRAVAAGYSQKIIESSPHLRELRGDPQFAQLLARD